MKICVFCPTLNVYGGGEFVAVAIANTLAQNGYDVVFFTNEEVAQWELEKFFGKRLNSSIKVIVKPSIFEPRGLLDFYQTIFRSFVMKSKCNILVDVYSNCIFPWANITYIHFPFLNHEFYKEKFPYIKSGNLLPIGGLPYAFAEKNLISDDWQLILANSQYTANEIAKFSGKKAEVLYPPVPSTFFLGESVEKFCNSKREDLIVTISRFEPGKGLEKIPYIASLTEENIKFAIIGRLHYENILTQLQKIINKLGLADRVKTFPDISKVRMKEILEKAKVYLHTKVGEHFGISIVEAMAIGCMPIVHDSGGPKEFVPKDLRYTTIHEAAAKITKEVHKWSPQDSIKIMKIAEKFKEEYFSEKFTEFFNQYRENLKNKNQV